MFTGIVTDIGELVARAPGRFTIACHYPAETITLGASIACAGCCLTVTDIRTHNDGRTAIVLDVSPETLAVTTLDTWHPGHRVNLERSLTLGAELGGHMVAGHVDGIARVIERRQDGDHVRFTFEVAADLARFVAKKGSVALDGTSLTVNEVAGNRFGVSLIPHTLSQTTWGAARDGDRVNFEVDLMARYVARLAETSAPN